jgi:hypothetical protein
VRFKRRVGAFAAAYQIEMFWVGLAQFGRTRVHRPPRHRSNQGACQTRASRVSRPIPLLVAVAVFAAASASFAYSSFGGELVQQTSRERGVTVRARPLELSPGANVWTFEVVLETHSVELTDDLADRGDVGLA